MSVCVYVRLLRNVNRDLDFFFFMYYLSIMVDGEAKTIRTRRRISSIYSVITRIMLGRRFVVYTFIEENKNFI